MLLLIYFLLSLFLVQNISCSACIDAERTALLQFKSKLEPTNDSLPAWDGQNCCNWEGITCHHQSGHVLKLNLRGNLEIPWYGEIDWTSLVSLKYLRHLNLSWDNMYGTLPNLIGQFENLVYLNLSWAELNGEIPTEIGNLKKLRVLDMSHTNVNGSIPPQIGNLKRLHVLDMSNTYVKGFIPPHLGNISTLTFLSFRNDFDINFLKIENIEWISKLNSLQHLALDSVKILSFTDWFYWLNQLQNLKVLSLSGCNLLTIPAKVPSLNLTSLTTLDLSYSSFKSQVPSWMGNLISISYLDLSNAGFHGSPNNIVNLSKLNYLDLSNNQMEGIISDVLFENQTQLQVLNLSHNMLKLVIDHSWLPKFQLEDLRLQSCEIGPSFPSWLKYQTQIIYLDLKNSSINDALPPWFWRPSYHYIDLSYNNLRGKLPHNLHMPNLTILVLASNNLEGPIEFSQNNNLYVLEISNNSFSGTLQWVSNLTGLAGFFSVKNNIFIGQIPSSICYLSLDVLVGNNARTGSLTRIQFSFRFSISNISEVL